MKTKEFVSDLKKSESFKEFKKKYKDSYLCAAFFVVGSMKQVEVAELDYYIKSKKRIASFKYPLFDFNIHCDKIDSADKQKEDVCFDYLDVFDICQNLIKEKSKNFNLSKMIMILKNDIWNVSCISTSLSLFKAKVDSKTGRVIFFESAGLFDFAKVQKKKD